VRIPRAEAREDPTASATVISAERFEGEAKDVAALLATAPGVAIVRQGTLGQRVTVQLRGVSAEGVKVLLDGLPLGSAAGGVDLATIPRHWIERVEVVRGLAGARHGTGALGGAVDVITRAPRAGEASAELSGGSFGTYAAGADGALRVGRFGLLLGASGETTRGDFGYGFDRLPSTDGNALEPHTRAHNGAARAGALAKLGGLVGRLRLDALAQLSGGSRDLPGAPACDRGGDVCGPAGDWQEDGRALAMVRVSGLPRPGAAAALRVQARADRLDTRLAVLGPSPVRQRGGALGLEAEGSVARGNISLGGSTTAELEGYDSVALGGLRTRATLGAALAGELSAAGGRVRVSPAVRAERTGDDAGLSTTLGAALRVARDLTVRASAGRTYRVPTFAELYLEHGVLKPNAELEPETGTGGDATLVYDGPFGVASLGGHAALLRDAISYEPDSFRRFRPINVGRALLAGVEVEAATAPAPRLLGLAVSGAYTWLPTRVLRGVEGVVGNRLAARPLHRLHARASVAPGRLGAHLEAQLVRGEFQDARNLDPVPDALVLGAGASLRLARSPSVSIHVQLDNLTDDRALTDDFGQPLPGRTLTVSVRAGASAKDPRP
jgi:iron complex outermembrane receptor protein